MWQRLLFALSVFINISLLARLIWSDSGFVGYKELSKQHAELEFRLDEINKKNIILSREIRLLQSDDKYIEKMIRTKLNFVRDNEILYLFSNDSFSINNISAGVLINEGKN